MKSYKTQEQPILKQYSPKCDRTKYVDRWCYVWEADVANKVKAFGYGNILGKTAKNDGWFGYVYDNGVIPMVGLANYLAEIYTQIIFNGEIDSGLEMLPRGLRDIPELNQAALLSFKEFLASDSFKNLSIERILIERESDILTISNKNK
jgi:hypothetical protein